MYPQETAEEAVAANVATDRTALMVDTGLAGLWAPAAEGIHPVTHCILVTL